MMLLIRTHITKIFFTALATLIVPAPASPVSAQQPKEPNGPRMVHANGVTLHYIEQGHGIPVILVHGGLVDYRCWEAQMEPFSRDYRVIAYSRRYNYPNNNPNIRLNHSAIVEAEDLAALITKLGLGHVHLVGHSYGAYTALFLAVKHPEQVRTLVLAEPPVHRWVQKTPEGKPVFEEFMTNIWRPAGQAFRRGDDEQALRLTTDYFVGKGAFDQLPQKLRTILMDNIREWKALTTSRDAFPTLLAEQVKRITMPVLMLTGERTLKIHQLVNDDLERLLPNGERVRIDATHEMWEEKPEECRRATLAFLSKH
jgi:non-heme chloroperoxidase